MVDYLNQGAQRVKKLSWNDFRVTTAMNFLGENIPTLVFQLLPGFVAASIFYTLTAHPKTTEFERVIQALIFTVLLKVVLIPARGCLLLAGKRACAVGTWNADAELAWMIVLAL